MDRLPVEQPRRRGVYRSRTNLCGAGAYCLQSRQHCIEIADDFLLTVEVASHRGITELRGQSFRSRLSVLSQATGVRENEYRRSRLPGRPGEMSYHLEAIGLVLDVLSFHVYLLSVGGAQTMRRRRGVRNRRSG